MSQEEADKVTMTQADASKVLEQPSELTQSEVIARVLAALTKGEWVTLVGDTQVTKFVVSTVRVYDNGSG